MNHNAIESLALAPMEGVTDEVVRAIFADLGAVDYVVTEFIRVTSEVLTRKLLFRACPELFDSATLGPVPVHVQLLGGNAELVAESARVAVSCGAHTIDLNFGCPANTVNRHDGGATLLKNPARVEEVLTAVTRAVGKDIAVSAKVRLGWDRSETIVEIAKHAEQGGARWLTVHGRTRTQGYAPPANWQAIGQAREAVRIPVIANGDLFAPEDLAVCQAESGCTRFMLGRGAIARPELFRVIRGLQPSFDSSADRLQIITRFISESMARGEDRERVTLARTKQWLRVMGGAEPEIAQVFEIIKRTETLNECSDRLLQSRETLSRGEPLSSLHTPRTPSQTHESC
ncbi:MAG: tRNA-dihydrouridine synthase family protein [Deltaproteobacteria bacterium]|nr:tRNA-dihydrouridine synthase family protein [Deltaproteobacteria bacterium]